MTQPRSKVLVAAYEGIDVAALEAVMSQEPGLLLLGVVDGDSVWTSRASYDADVLVVACADAQLDALRLIEQEAITHPQLPVVVVSGGSPNGFVRQVFEAGADDIVVGTDLDTVGPELFFAIEKARTRKAGLQAQDHTDYGDLICVLGPKGGTGKTLTSSNLAAALALEGRRVALIDLDLQFGDLGLVMGINPKRTIFDLATSGGTLDAEKVGAFMSRHACGVDVLLAPSRPDHASAISTDFLRDLYSVVRSVYEFTIVDTPPGFTPEVIATIDAATEVCLIGTLDAPSLKNAKLGWETLQLMAYPSEHVRIVLNRADTNVGVSHADVVSVLGRAPDVLIPSHRDVVRSVNSGEPIVLSSSRSEAAKRFRALGRLVMASRPAVPEPHARRRGRRL